MRLLHRDVEFDLGGKMTSNLQIKISISLFTLYRFFDKKLRKASCSLPE